MISKTCFFFSETVNSRQKASLLSNHKSHYQLVSSLNSCATRAQIQADKQLFRWINEHVHTCRDACTPCLSPNMLTCCSHSMSNLLLTVLFLSNPLYSFSASVSPVTKGVFLQRASETFLHTK